MSADNRPHRQGNELTESTIRVGPSSHPLVLTWRRARQHVDHRIKHHHDKGHDIWLSFFQILLSLGTLLTTVHLATTSAESTAQTSYTEAKIDRYMHLAALLRDGRNPHGRNAAIDTLPIHRDSIAMYRWWYAIDDYYQANWLFFDSVSRIKYAKLNELVLRDMDTLIMLPASDIRRRHELKQPMVDKCEDLIAWFKKYLDDKYDTESHRKFFWQSNG